MSNDLISREALIKWIDDSISQYGHTYSTDMLNMWGLFKDYLINNAPTVDISKEVWEKANELLEKRLTYLERPKGEWIIVKDERYGDNVKCPFCEKELAGTDLNFCCKCGAKLLGSEKMNGGTNGETT